MLDDLFGSHISIHQVTEGNKLHPFLNMNISRVPYTTHVSASTYVYTRSCGKFQSIAPGKVTCPKTLRCLPTTTVIKLCFLTSTNNEKERKTWLVFVLMFQMYFFYLRLDVSLLLWMYFLLDLDSSPPYPSIFCLCSLQEDVHCSFVGQTSGRDGSKLCPFYCGKRLRPLSLLTFGQQQAGGVSVRLW